MTPALAAGSRAQVARDLGHLGEVAETVLNHIHTYIHTYMHTYIHTYAHTYVQLYIDIYIHMCRSKTLGEGVNLVAMQILMTQISPGNSLTVIVEEANIVRPRVEARR